MGKHYGKAIIEEVLKLKVEGKTHREIAQQFGLTKVQIKKLVERHNKAERKIEAGILPCRRGRPSRGCQPTEQEKDNEIKRLKMENELLRDFLRIAGRK